MNLVFWSLLIISTKLKEFLPHFRGTTWQNYSAVQVFVKHINSSDDNCVSIGGLFVPSLASLFQSQGISWNMEFSSVNADSGSY